MLTSSSFVIFQFLTSFHFRRSFSSFFFSFIFYFFICSLFSFFHSSTLFDLFCFPLFCFLFIVYSFFIFLFFLFSVHCVIFPFSIFLLFHVFHFSHRFFQTLLVFWPMSKSLWAPKIDTKTIPKQTSFRFFFHRFRSAVCPFFHVFSSFLVLDLFHHFFISFFF